MSSAAGDAGSAIKETLDLTSASLNLASALTALPGAPAVSAAMRAASSLLKWCGREGVSEDALAEVFFLMHDMAQPNARALDLIGRPETAASRLSGFHLVTPGSLGRLVLRDEHQIGLATTVAALLVDHDMEYVSGVISFIVLQRARPLASVAEYLLRRRTGTVVRKAVEIIGLHVFNMSGGTPAMPSELSALRICDIGEAELAKAMAAIQELSRGHAMIVGFFAPDLFLWIHLRWPGRVEVSRARDAAVIYRAVSHRSDSTPIRTLSHIVTDRAASPFDGMSIGRAARGASGSQTPQLDGDAEAIDGPILFVRNARPPGGSGHLALYQHVNQWDVLQQIGHDIRGRRERARRELCGPSCERPFEVDQTRPARFQSSQRSTRASAVLGSFVQESSTPKIDRQSHLDTPEAEQLELANDDGLLHAEHPFR